MADDYSTELYSAGRKYGKLNEVEMFLGYGKKKEEFYYEHNDIQLLLGVETSAETKTLILEITV